MIIHIDPGHGCPPDTGAVGHGKKEDLLVKKLAQKVSDKLQEQGHETIVFRPSWSRNVNTSLAARAKHANKKNADLFISLHFNAFSNPAANGTETWIYSASSKAKDKANAIVNEMADLGYRRRGVKIGNFAVLRLTNMPAILIECCFLTNYNDIDNYDEDKFAEAITKGVLQETYIDLSQEQIQTEEIELEVLVNTYLKPSTEQSVNLNKFELANIPKGKYKVELLGAEENHYLIKFKDEFDTNKEYFIFSGHCKCM